MTAISKQTPAGALRVARIFPPTAVAELERLEQDLGGRQAVVSLLTLAPLTPDLRYILGQLGDPQHATMTLAEICTGASILPGELLKQLAQAALLRGKVLASQQIGNGIAAVAADVMRRAAPYTAPCHTCIGTGSITPEPTPTTPNPRPEPCEVCKGTGQLVYQPDLDRQKLAIDMAQLLPKGGGIQIAQINAPAAGGGGSSLGTLEALQRLTDRILYGSGMPGVDEVDESEAAEGEVVHSADPAPESGSGVADEP